MRDVTEVTLRQFVESSWFKLLARGAAIAGSLMAASVGVYFLSLGNRVTMIEADRTLKIQEYNMRLSTIDRKVTDLGLDIDSVKSDTVSTKVDIGTVKGMLTELTRRNVAELNPRLSP